MTLLQDWDKSVDACNDLMGQPRIGTRHTLYFHVDLQNRSTSFRPGYPMANDRYDPKMKYDGYHNNYIIRGPKDVGSHVFHELGHSYWFVKFRGEQESTVNLLHVAVMHRMFGDSLDDAFSASRSFRGDTRHTVDNTAITWMMSLHFLEREPMANFEAKYQ